MKAAETIVNSGSNDNCMVSQCANPNCRAPFRFMHTGRIFRFDFPIEEPPGHAQDILWDADGIPRRTELFWLCERCAQEFTLIQPPGTTKVEIERLGGGAAKAQAN